MLFGDHQGFLQKWFCIFEFVLSTANARLLAQPILRSTFVTISKWKHFLTAL